MNAVEVRRYEPTDATDIRTLLQSEGSEWSGYHDEAHFSRYRDALESSTTYVLLADGAICGFLRARDDDGFGVYVYDLLVHAARRGHAYGRALLDGVARDHPGAAVVVMSDVDEYYRKVGLRHIGSLFELGDGTTSR